MAAAATGSPHSSWDFLLYVRTNPICNTDQISCSQTQSMLRGTVTLIGFAGQMSMAQRFNAATVA
jgi:hypothetical protein